jgi:hypothetical protein
MVQADEGFGGREQSNGLPRYSLPSTSKISLEIERSPHLPGSPEQKLSPFPTQYRCECYYCIVLLIVVCTYAPNIAQPSLNLLIILTTTLDPLRPLT